MATIIPWRNNGWDKFKLVRYDTIGDGSCFFHAFLHSFYIPYRISTYEEKRLIVRDFRTQLSTELVLLYDSLSRGQLCTYAQFVPEYSLSNMCARLDSYQSVGNEFNELLSNIFNKDIYILSGALEDPYMMSDNGIYYKGRDSIVLLYSNSHYELVGLRDGENGNNIHTLFTPYHDFITFIQERMRK